MIISMLNLKKTLYCSGSEKISTVWRFKLIFAYEINYRVNAKAINTFCTVHVMHIGHDDCFLRKL